MTNIKVKKLKRRHKRVRSRVVGTAARPRLSVFRSGKHIYAQIINDEEGKTMVGMSDTGPKNKKASLNKSEVARALGVKIAESAKKNKIKKVVFDRGGRAYQGRVKALAEGAREGGLEF